MTCAIRSWRSLRTTIEQWLSPSNGRTPDFLLIVEAFKPQCTRGLQMSRDLSESQPAASDESIGDDDIKSDHPIKTDTQNRPVCGSKCVSRSYVVKYEVPEGMDCPPCSNPIRRAA